MVVDEQEPTGDEEADFADMLRKFKQGVAENVDDEDHQSHYDLGVAYKEMGLLDEAIAEFQKALRAPTNRVPTYEALGQCFIEKEPVPDGGDDPRARARTSRTSATTSSSACSTCSGAAARRCGSATQALDYYQRVFVLDIQFRDVADRLAALERCASMSGVRRAPAPAGDAALRDIQAPGARAPRAGRRRDAAHRHRRPAAHRAGERAPAADARQDVPSHARAARERGRRSTPEPRAVRWPRSSS